MDVSSGRGGSSPVRVALPKDGGVITATVPGSKTGCAFNGAPVTGAPAKAWMGGAMLGTYMVTEDQRFDSASSGW